MTTTLRQQVETEATSWAEWHRSHGQAVSRRTEQAMTEADACAAAYALIGQAHRRPYAGDPDLKRLRRDALDALMTLDRASGAVAHRNVADLPSLLLPGDLLVVNDTRVVPARFFGLEAEGRRALRQGVRTVRRRQPEGGRPWLI